MNHRVLLPPCLIVLVFAAGCSTHPAQPVAQTQSATQTQPGFGTVTSPSTEEFKAVAIEVKSTRIYVDVLPVMETRDGLPVVNIAHGTGAGLAAMSALQEAFATRGFRAASGEFTSMGLGGPAKPILLTHGPEAPVPSILPVIVSPGLAGTERGAWIGSLYTAVHRFASGNPTPITLAATYLSPNLNRIEVFAVLSGGTDSQAHIWVVAFDSRTGRALWTGSASENAAVLDTAVATSLVRSLVRNLPVLTAPARRS